MDSKQFHRRVWAMVLLLALMVVSMGAALYDLQINNGESYYQLTQKKVAEAQTVSAVRGNLYDRNGQVLVSNKIVYQVVLDTKRMGKTQGERNQVLLSLIQAARAENVEWTDNLPITKVAPFSFTTDEPYFTTGLDEDGNVEKILTRLGRLAVNMKWIDDPTKDPEEEEEPEAPKEPSLTERIKAFFGMGKQKEEAPKGPEGPEPLPGAEKLLGKGDMLYAPLGQDKLRVQGCFITEEEVANVVDFIKEGASAQYDEQVMHEIEKNAEDKNKAEKGVGGSDPGAGGGDDYDELLPAAIDVVLEVGQASVSMLQRRLKLGYGRAARLVDQMEEKGVVGPFEGSKPRQLLITKEQWAEMQYKRDMAASVPEELPFEGDALPQGREMPPGSEE